MQNPNQAFTFDRDTHYVVDLNAALNFPEFFDPTAKLPERHLIISRIYQKSLHKMREENSDRGTAASDLAKLLYELITQGRKTQNDGAEEYHLGEKLHVIFDYQDHNYTGRHIDGEHIKETIALAEYWSTQSTINHVTVLTNDPIMQISAQDRPKLDIHMFSPAPYIGRRRIYDEDAINYWRKSKNMSLSTFYSFCSDTEPLKPNEFVLFGKTNSFGHIGRYDANRERIVPLKYYRELHNVTPTSEQQAMAIEALMAPADEIGVVILFGSAGSGKTFATTACALAQTGIADARYIDLPRTGEPAAYSGRQNGKRNRKKSASVEDASAIMLPNREKQYPYQNIAFLPPDSMLGVRMAAVPGDERAKLAGKTYAIRDNIEAYLRVCGDKKEGGLELTERDLDARAASIMNQIDLFPLGEINGRSFWNEFLICDEAQFYTLAQIKACIERCDCGTKLALCGDPSQINNPFSWYGNSLARAVRYLGGDPKVAVIRFEGEENIRRPGAQIIARSWPH